MLVVRAQKFVHVSSFAFHSVFLYQLHAPTCPVYNVLLEVVCCSFPRNKLNMPMFVGSQSFISLPSFMFVSAVVSEIRDLKKEKEKEKKNNSEMDYFQFNTFPGHLIF